jgi:hypothetical protein
MHNPTVRCHAVKQNPSIRQRRRFTTCLSLLPLMAMGWCAGTASAAQKIAILDFADTYTSTKGLGTLLEQLGRPCSDLTDRALGGEAINLAGYDVFIVGGFTTQSVKLRGTQAGTHPQERRRFRQGPRAATEAPDLHHARGDFGGTT